MTAKNLIEAAKKIGMGIGRYSPNRYYYTQVVNGIVIENEFSGSFREFSLFIQRRIEIAAR